MDDLRFGWLWHRVSIMYLENFLEPYYLRQWLATFDLSDRLVHSLTLEQPPDEYLRMHWGAKHNTLCDEIELLLRNNMRTVSINELQLLVHEEVDSPTLHRLAGVLKMRDVMIFVLIMKGETFLAFRPLS